eukprot:7871776-Pyramimonas_sp.AAC.1
MSSKDGSGQQQKRRRVTAGSKMPQAVPAPQAARASRRAAASAAAPAVPAQAVPAQAVAAGAARSAAASAAAPTPAVPALEAQKPTRTIMDALHKSSAVVPRAPDLPPGSSGRRLMRTENAQAPAPEQPPAPRDVLPITQPLDPPPVERPANLIPATEFNVNTIRDKAKLWTHMGVDVFSQWAGPYVPVGCINHGKLDFNP